MPPPDSPEHVRAKWWREHIAQLSQRELAALTGFSISRIVDIEAGVTRGSGEPIDSATMTRYRMVCAAVTLGARFDWLTLSLVPQTAVEIRVGNAPVVPD